MRWQDMVLTAGSVVFILALLPSLRSSAKPALATSALTASVLVSFAVVYADLNLWFAAVTTALTSGCWWLLAYQKRRMSRLNRGEA